MCGIAAIFNLTEASGVISKIKEMTDIIRHRGPDDEGFALFDNRSKTVEFYGGLDTPQGCYAGTFKYAPRRKFSSITDAHCVAAFGHRRLAIIDLSPAGHQPMCTEDGRYTITYNGEIYNYQQLRKELEGLGYLFISSSDTEVILNAYRYWGKSCLHKFNGMFAFIIYDRFERRLFAARDRFGVKPLYFWRSSCGFLAFASEIKQFTVLPGWRATLNAKRAYDFLNWNITDHSEETLFAGVSQLQGGEYVECNLAEIRQKLPVRRWYYLTAGKFGGNFKDAVKIFRDLFADSVRLRLRADVPVGTGLSGGLDSSSIVCLINNLLGEQNSRVSQQTFSACSLVKSFDEREFIDAVVKYTGVSAHYTYPAIDDLSNILPQLIWHHDEPFSSTSIYAEWCVFDLAARNGVKVTLDGHGLDELLAGYHCFFSTYFAGLFRNLRWWRLHEEIKNVQKIHGYNLSYTIRQMCNLLLPEMVRQPLKKILGAVSVSPEWINMKLLNIDKVDPFTRCGSKTVSLQQFSIAQVLHTSLPMQLHWTDRDAMAHSVEARGPFLDYRIVEFLISLPDDYKIAQGVTKKILREAMTGILPEKIRMRMDKIGFVTPEKVWVTRHRPDWFRKEIKKAVDQSRGILKPSVIEKAEKIISGKGHFDYFLWRVLCFGKWMEKFNVDI